MNSLTFRLDSSDHHFGIEIQTNILIDWSLGVDGENKIKAIISQKFDSKIYANKMYWSFLNVFFNYRTDLTDITSFMMIIGFMCL